MPLGQVGAPTTFAGLVAATVIAQYVPVFVHGAGNSPPVSNQGLRDSPGIPSGLATVHALVVPGQLHTHELAFVSHSLAFHCGTTPAKGCCQSA